MQAAYDDIATWYDQSVRGDSPIDAVTSPALFELIGSVHGQRVLDFACGQGHIARALAIRGAQVTGVDISAELIAIAVQHEMAKPLGIRYIVDDATALSSSLNDAFEGVVCVLALMDIPNLAGAFQAMQRVLRSQGWLAFVITHPCFEPPHAEWRKADDGRITREVKSYFVEGFWRSDNPNGVRGRVGAHHRTLSTYVNTLIEAGFDIERMIEPQASEIVARQIPGYAIAPAFLIVRARKQK